MRIVCIVAVAVSFGVWAEDAPPAGGGGPGMLDPAILEGLEEYWTAEDAPMMEGDRPIAAVALTVAQCVDMAVARNGQALVAQDEVDAAAAKMGQAGSAILPQAKAQMAFVYVEGLESASDWGVLDFLIPGDLAGENETRRDQISFQQVLYAGGQIRAAMRASEYLMNAQEWRRQAAISNLVFETQQAYYDCLLARAMVRVAEESVVTFERHVADAQQMFDVGLISHFEVLRAKTELGARQSDAVAARNAERLARVNLRRVICMEQDAPIRLKGVLDCPPIRETLDELLEEAFEARPELIALRKAIAAAEENVKRAKGQFKPRLAATADWANTDGGGQFMPDGWTFSIGAEWDIYTGGRRKCEVAEAKAQVSSLKHQQSDLRRLVELDVRQAYIHLQDSLAKIRSEKGTVELGKEGRRLAQLRFQEGVGTQAETLDAELALTGAETKLVQALREYMVGIASLQRALGRTDVHCGVSPAPKMP